MRKIQETIIVKNVNSPNQPYPNKRFMSDYELTNLLANLKNLDLYLEKYDIRYSGNYTFTNEDYFYEIRSIIPIFQGQNLLFTTNLLILIDFFPKEDF